jgi:hypothetical protein
VQQQNWGRRTEVNDILRWAKEADLWMTSDERIAAVERFAALVRADEREACAKVAKETVCDMHLGTGIKIYGTRAAAAIRARGQEA